MDLPIEDLLPSQILEDFIYKDNEWTLPLLSEHDWEAFELDLFD